MNRSARKFADKVALVTSGSSGLGLLTWVAVPLITRALHGYLYGK